MKILTTASMIGSAILCFVYIYLLAAVGNPHNTRVVKIGYLQKMEITLILLLIFIAASVIGSVMIVRQAREVYRKEALENMQLLVEIAQLKKEDNPDA